MTVIVKRFLSLLPLPYLALPLLPLFYLLLTLLFFPFLPIFCTAIAC